MKAGRSLPELAQELCRQANAKRDFLAPVTNLGISSNGHSRLFINSLIGDPFLVNDIAHQQIAEYAGIPKAFYDRLRSASETLRVPIRRGEDEVFDNAEPHDASLFDTLVSTLLTAKPDNKRLIRTLDGTCRAFLSDSFNPDLDNFDVFQVAAKVITDQGLGPENVVSAEVTERKLYLKVVSPKLEAVIEPSNIRDSHGYLKEPQIVQAGFILSNSEVGLASLSVQQIVYKLMCTNLWIKEDAYRQRHLGRTLDADEDGTLYRSDTRLADSKARLLKIRDHVEAALDEAQFQALVAKMQETTEVRLEGGIEKVVEVTGRKFGLLQSEKDAVLRHLIEGADLSLWGLSNAVTATAAEVTSYDRATELEAIGGRFFSLSREEIREVAQAS